MAPGGQARGMCHRVAEVASARFLCKNHRLRLETPVKNPQKTDTGAPAPADHGRALGKARAAERVAAALRENLKRRKAAARAKGERKDAEPA